jgi:purine nucleosidase
MVPIVLDTDIGTDVDDALALVTAIGSEALQLVGVTTAYVDAPWRAKIAESLLATAGRKNITVSAGESVPLRPVPARLTHGAWEWHEGRGLLYDEITDEEQEYLIGLRAPERPYLQVPIESRPAVDELIRLAHEHPKLRIICIGPLTNVATALMRDPSFEQSVGGLTIMGAYFAKSGRPRLEHNFASDVGAAEVVFRSSLPITVLSGDVTEFTYLDTEKLRPLYSLHTPLAAAIGRLIEVYLTKKGRTHTYVHDPLAVGITENPNLAIMEDVLVYFDPLDGRTSLHRTEGAMERRLTQVKDLWLRRSHTFLYERLLAVCSE